MRTAAFEAGHPRAGLAAIAVLAGVLLACSGTTTQPRTDPRACQQTYEFGNTGCAVVEGQVVDAADHPLAGISVGPRYLDETASFNTVYSETDAAGRFSLRVTRFGPRPTNATAPDTLSFYVLAVDPSSAGVNMPATVRDSVLVRVTVAPLGSIPTPATAVVRLATP